LYYLPKPNFQLECLLMGHVGSEAIIVAILDGQAHNQRERSENDY
jgi:hypothetical protein